MKIILNLSNIVKGGAIQVALSTLQELMYFKENQYSVFLSEILSLQVQIEKFPENFEFYLFETSPSKLSTYFQVQKKLNHLEKQIKPNVVFTLFGPAYWRPKAIHFSGFADGWCYFQNSIAFKRLPFTKRIKVKFLIAIKNFLIKKADFIIVETETAKIAIKENLKIEEDFIFVVGNTAHQVFWSHKIGNSSHNNDKLELLVLSSFYSHKNLEIINDVVNLLEDRGVSDVLFKLTIPKSIFTENFISSDLIENLGPQDILNCPNLYESTDALFLPSLLETFTANYPEAMIMDRAILTSNLDFAKELCQDAALYFDPLDPEDIIRKVLIFKEDMQLKNDLVEKGRVRLKAFQTPRSRVENYLSIFSNHS